MHLFCFQVVQDPAAADGDIADWLRVAAGHGDPDDPLAIGDADGETAEGVAHAVAADRAVDAIDDDHRNFLARPPVVGLDRAEENILAADRAHASDTSTVSASRCAAPPSSRGAGRRSDLGRVSSAGAAGVAFLLAGVRTGVFLGRAAIAGGLGRGFLRFGFIAQRRGRGQRAGYWLDSRRRCRLVASQRSMRLVASSGRRS